MTQSYKHEEYFRDFDTLTLDYAADNSLLEKFYWQPQYLP